MAVPLLLEASHPPEEYLDHSKLQGQRCFALVSNAQFWVAVVVAVAAAVVAAAAVAVAAVSFVAVAAAVEIAIVVAVVVAAASLDRMVAVALTDPPVCVAS